MSETDAKHQALLDALEQAGFPRSSLVGTGNSIYWTWNGGPAGHAAFTVRREADDPEDKITIRMTMLSGIGTVDAHRIGKEKARQLGAFLLAWGYSP